MKSIFAKTLPFILILSFCLVSCSRKEKVSFTVPADGLELNVQDASNDENITDHKWHNEDNKTICVLFGYGFNDKEYYEEMRSKLSSEFGLTEEGGLVWTVLYPDDVKSRIMNLYDLINARDISGIIILGAPERTHFMLAKIQDFWNNEVPYPVFSFFPQDDILGSESTCDFVLEYEHDAKEEAESTEISQGVDFDISGLLINAIHYMSELDTSIAYDKELSTHVKNITDGRKIYRYTDSESGLHPVNHFILGRKEDSN